MLNPPGYARREVEMVSGPGGTVKAVTQEGDADVDLASELGGMIDSKKAYEANVAVMETGKEMWDALMSALVPQDRDHRWG